MQAKEAKKDAEHPSTELYRKGLALQKRKKWGLAKRAFQKMLKKYPESPWAHDAEMRGGENGYLGTTVLWRGGPPERRIDVSVMGDGFTTDAADQKMEERWAKSCVDVLWSEKAFSEYRNYFNIYFVRLASLEEGVDPQLSPEEKAKIEERNRRRRGKKKKIDFNTALDAKAAGPQGQVLMNRGLVYKWLEYAGKEVPGCDDDRQVIAFARFGRLGMGGGGIANVGRPDKSITTHEFGHSFVRLLDEYTGNPNPPRGGATRWLRAANVSISPDPDKVPWAHMLKAKIKGVGIYEGGATYTKGVWRSARTCAMNAAGAVGFCPVCREAAVLVIHEYVSPIDEAEPAPGKTVQVVSGDKEAQLLVTPMQPQKHKLLVSWYVQPLAAITPRVEDTPEERDGGSDSARPPGGSGTEDGCGCDDGCGCGCDDGCGCGDDDDWDWSDDWGPEADEDEGKVDPAVQRRVNRSYRGFGGDRHRADRRQYAQPPPGKPSKLGKRLKGSRKQPVRHRFPIGKLKPGRYQVTVEVSDPTPWVLKDPHHLLKERAVWIVEVAAPPEKEKPGRKG